MHASGTSDDLGVVLAVGVADQVLDAGQVGLDLPEGERGLDDGDAGHAGTSSRVVAGAGSCGATGWGGCGPHRARVLRARDDARGPEAVGAALTADLEHRCAASRTARLSVSARGRSPRQSAATSDAGHARQRRDLLQRAGAAEEVAQVGLGGPPGVAKQLAQGRGLALDARVEVGEVVGGQAVAVALGLPGARRPVDRGWVVEGGSTCSARVRPIHIASRIPCPVTGSLKCPASPASAQPGPDEARKKAGVSPVERSLV